MDVEATGISQACREPPSKGGRVSSPEESRSQSSWSRRSGPVDTCDDTRIALHYIVRPGVVSFLNQSLE